MMKKPDISVILPFYNASQHLSEAIQSVLLQTFTNFELILINDGSTDESLKIAKTFEKKDKRITILNQNNLGMATALNNGIESSTTNLIARMDGDDICDPNRFQLQFELIQTLPANSLVSSLVTPFSSGKISEGTMRYFYWLNSKITSKNILDGLFKESPLIHPSVLFTKEAFYNAGKYIEYNGPEDYDLWLKMAETGTIFAKVDKVLLNYRIHSNNLSRNDMTHYGREAFRERQYHHLSKMIISNFFGPNKRFIICGAGKEGRRILNYLSNFNINISNFIDVDPKKIGKKINNVEVLPITQIKKDPDKIYLGATGSWESEEQLVSLFKSRRMNPIDNFLIL